MTLLATGTLAAATPGRARAVEIRKAPAGAPRSAEIEKGIAEQKGYLAGQLKVIRDFPLPAGRDPAFVFAPLPGAPRRTR